MLAAWPIGRPVGRAIIFDGLQIEIVDRCCMRYVELTAAAQAGVVQAAAVGGAV